MATRKITKSRVAHGALKGWAEFLLGGGGRMGLEGSDLKGHHGISAAA